MIDTIKNYNTENLESFTGIFRHSNLSSDIDATEDSIVSNITTVKLHRELDVQYNSNSTYTIYLGNPIYYSGVAENSVTSTGFYIQGNENIMYLEDSPTGEHMGVLKMYYYIADIKTYYRTFGTIDYTSGTITMNELEITGIDQEHSDFSIDYTSGTITMNELEITGIDQEHSDIFELIIKPQSNDIVSIRNQLVNIPDDYINVTMVLDKVSVGDPGGGANYIFTSSRN